MIFHDSRNANYRRPFGAAAVCAHVYLAAEGSGEEMTLRLRRYDGSETFHPMTRRADGRFEITFTEEAEKATFVAGAKLENGKLLTSGGRVTGTTAVADSLETAIKEAYRIADGVQFEKSYRRSDIGQRALAAYK